MRPALKRHPEYLTVSAKLANRTDRAVLLDSDDWDELIWVPRYALHPLSNLTVDRAALKDELDLRIEERLALSKGLV